MTTKYAIPTSDHQTNGAPLSENWYWLTVGDTVWWNGWNGIDQMMPTSQSIRIAAKRRPTLM